MIRHLVEALDDRNPIYVDEAAARAVGHPGVVAPPTSLQVWIMGGLRRHAPSETEPAGSGGMTQPAEDDRQGALMGLLDAEGYVGVVATNCEQTYSRYLTLGDHLRVSSHLKEISGLKHTALGEGFFVTTEQTYRDHTGEVVGQMLFRILKYRPGTGKERSPVAAGPRRPPSDVSLPPLEIAAHADGDRVHRDRHAGLPGRAPRQGPRSGARLREHLHEHPHDQRLRRPLHHRLGRPGRPPARAFRSGWVRPTTRATR